MEILRQSHQVDDAPIEGRSVHNVEFLEQEPVKVARVIEVLDARNGRFNEQTLHLGGMGKRIPEAALPYPRDHRGRITVSPDMAALREAAPGIMTTANFPDLLRQGLSVDLFTSYREAPKTYPLFCQVVESSKQKEEYARDVGIGLPPIVQEGQNYPEIAVGVGDGVIIANHKRGYIITITEEMQLFDQVGKVRDLPLYMGRSFSFGEEVDAYNVVTTSGNYTRNSTTGDNDYGANTQSLQFSGNNLLVAYNVLRTMKDRRSGLRLGVQPDTLIVSPSLELAAKQLLMSPTVNRVGGNTTNEIYGGGTNNPFQSMVRQIIVSPEMNDGHWCLMESGRAVVFQRVLALELIRTSPDGTSPDYFNNDLLKFRARTFYGVGMKDDRFAFLSTSTSAPIVT